MTKEITIKRYDIAKPEQVQSMAVVLKDYIIKNNLTADIQGKKYAMVEGWQFAGFLTGIMPIIESVENMSSATEIKWKATVKLMKGTEMVGIGMAICSNKEASKKSFAEYAILSMAQTRAIGKAYRNMLGWVMKLAGYEATPAEEIVEVKAKTLYVQAENMIENAKTVSIAISVDERAQKSTKLTAEEKKTLHIKAEARVTKLENEKSKK